jgi:hypothetical protein
VIARVLAVFMPARDGGQQLTRFDDTLLFCVCCCFASAAARLLTAVVLLAAICLDFVRGDMAEENAREVCTHSESLTLGPRVPLLVCAVFRGQSAHHLLVDTIGQHDVTLGGRQQLGADLLHSQAAVLQHSGT